jgi:hypothetical protein
MSINPERQMFISSENATVTLGRAPPTAQPAHRQTAHVTLESFATSLTLGCNKFFDGCCVFLWEQPRKVVHTSERIRDAQQAGQTDFPGRLKKPNGRSGDAGLCPLGLARKVFRQPAISYLHPNISGNILWQQNDIGPLIDIFISLKAEISRSIDIIVSIK